MPEGLIKYVKLFGRCLRAGVKALKVEMLKIVDLRKVLVCL